MTCQTCKLHGKMQLLGMGTALKVLLLPDEMVGAALSRDEVVALINTVGKFSHAITGARKLFNLDIARYVERVPCAVSRLCRASRQGCAPLLLDGLEGGVCELARGLAASFLGTVRLPAAPCIC